MLSPFEFPRLNAEGYLRTSDPTWDYNCIAWAATDTENWWWPFGKANEKEAYWPPSVPKALTLRSFTDAFKTLGFSICRKSDLQNPILEEGWEKVAIYALNNVPTHAARQKQNGK